MTNGLDLARSGDAFMSQLAHALSQQTPEVASVLERELFAGNYELQSGTGEKGEALLVLRIAGAVVMETRLFVEPRDVRGN